MKTVRIAAAAGAGVAALALAGPASAHVSPDKTEVAAGAYTAVTLSAGHGCDGSPTTAFEVQIPASINDVTPAVLPGWDIAIETEPLDPPVEGPHGEQITERESVVTYTAQPGNELPDGFRQSITIGFKAPDTPGEHLFFKTIQHCVEGENAWIEEYTGDGEEPENPAPVLLVTAASGDGHGGAADGDSTTSPDDGTDGDGATAEPGGGTDGDEAAAPSPAGDDDDGGGAATGIAVAGLVAGLLGLGAGGAALAKSRKPV